MNAKRAGYYRSNMSGDAAYKSFVPAKLPPQIEYGKQLTDVLVYAGSQVSLLEGLTARIPNMNLFVSMYVRKEALLSSQIEGTQATLEDVLDPTIDQNANQNVEDVINYIKATDFACAKLRELPLCNRFIRETHAVLLSGVRGQDESPGEFRHSQNWIGGQGSTLKNARYIPPNVDDMNEALSDLELFLNEEDTLEPLIKAALVHYQFETIHPFLDGNGRIGRLLIPLFLMEKKVLSSPALYVSYFLKLNRIEYYDRMTQVRDSGDYEQWIRFFLQAVGDSAQDAVLTIDALTALHNKNEQKLAQVRGRSRLSMMRLFEYLELSPIIEINKTAQDLQVSFNTVASAVDRLMELGILQQTPKTGRARTFAYEEYLALLRKDT